eukprot:NODE_1537_length_834_cov_116.513376_g1280_i0.p2 GENE.NODE_1537_length_834_cov_116.513376_g1280_i0~~NODE_1537_length_834_cov_116.513376_g1280_i0.p2  ORF type:complete len:210 (-),score=67.81 NODE_1537_length_834_cov_116.513376_g1280_i0:203-802(-)
MGEVEELDEATSMSLFGADLLRRGRMERRKIGLVRHMLWGKQKVVNRFLERTAIKDSDPEVYVYFRDLADGLERSSSRLDAIHEILRQSNDMFCANVGLETGQAANITNEKVKWLTVLALILAPFNLVAGFFGMNMPNPFHAEDPAWHNLVPWWVTIGSFAAACAAFVVWQIVLLVQRRDNMFSTFKVQAAPLQVIDIS